MDLMKIKDILTADIQRKTDRIVYIQALNNKLECIATKRDKSKSNVVVFVYNDNNEKNWTFNYNTFNSSLNSKVICAFVCKDDKELEEYHLISIADLFSLNNIDINEFIKNKQKNYTFSDLENKYKDNWKIFK